MEMGERPFQAASSGSLSQEETTSTSDSRGGLRITDSPCRVCISSIRMASPLSRNRMLHPSPARGILSYIHILVRIAESRRSGASLSGTVGELFGGSGRRVRDVIWGDVSIDRAVKTLLETGAMQRLKGMSQLGFTFGSFPRARHTRLDHAIG